MVVLPIIKEELQDSAEKLSSLNQPQIPGWPQSVGEFESLVDVLQDRLVWFAFCRLGNTQDAEDVIQDVLVRAFTDRARHQNVTQVVPYIYRMATNACIDLLRNRTKKSQVSIKTGDLSDDHRNAADSSAVAGDEIRRIEAVLGRLPRRQAEVIRLRVYDELSFSEISEVLGISVGTVKSRLRYGLKKIEKIVRREWRVSQ